MAHPLGLSALKTQHTHPQTTIYPGMPGVTHIRWVYTPHQASLPLQF